jgi:hypothetical protein
LVSIIFPEKIRYSILKDYFETEALSLGYVEFGSNYVDFSIGDFQIKPSFIEKIDSVLKSDSVLERKYNSLILKPNSKENVRKEIVMRLKNMQFQVDYVCAFYDICLKHFALTSISKHEKIRFLATAFNHGFLRPKTEIEEYINKPYFPYGALFPGKQYAYSDVSVYFFENDFSKIFMN